MKMDKVIGEVAAIKGLVDSVKADLVELNSRTGEAEQRISQLEDDNVKMNNTVASMADTISRLGERLQYQENYSRRNSILVKKMLGELFKETPDAAEALASREPTGRP